MDLSFYQSYWWLLISVLGALLVFLLFVQGGQTMFYCTRDPESRKLMVNALGRKWELTYTTLVVFGGAFFASFPLFYSTSFGGAYWLWMAILLSFVLQAFSYEFRSKPGNIYGGHTYDAFLMINGAFGCLLLGVAVGTMFFGGECTVTKANLVGTGNPVISNWAPTHGLEAMANWKCLLLGVTVFFLARTQAALYFVNAISDARGMGIGNRIKVLCNGVVFALLFVGFLVVLLTSPGVRFENGVAVVDPYCYWNNLLTMWWTIPMLLIGVVAVLYGILRTAFSTTWTKGIWYTGVGTVLAVLVLFFLAGYNGTAYLPSVVDPQSSLTIANSSSSLFTLKVMSCVSLVIPFVLAYIWYFWYKMNATPLTIQEVDSDSHSY